MRHLMIVVTLLVATPVLWTAALAVAVAPVPFAPLGANLVVLSLCVSWGCAIGGVLFGREG